MKLIFAITPPAELRQDGFADVVFDFAFFRFVWGPPPSSDELAHFLGPYTSRHDEGRHWSVWGEPRKTYKNWERSDFSLADFCQQFESVELWFDIRPEAQLKQVWLLDYFSSYPEIVAKLKLRLVSFDLMMWRPSGGWEPPVSNVTEKDLATACAAWQAYRSPTPKACIDLLHRDLSALPLLKPALVDLLEELPAASTRAWRQRNAHAGVDFVGLCERQSAVSPPGPPPDPRFWGMGVWLFARRAGFRPETGDSRS